MRVFYPRLCLFKPVIAPGSTAKVSFDFYLNALTNLTCHPFRQSSV